MIQNQSISQNFSYFFVTTIDEALKTSQNTQNEQSTIQQNHENEAILKD